MNQALHTASPGQPHMVEEPALLARDLDTLLDAVGVSALFLDQSLRIVRCTARIGDLFTIHASDPGRFLSEITHPLRYDGMIPDARRVLATAIPVEKEVQDDRGGWYRVRLSPHRDPEDHTEGVILTCVDVTAHRQAQEALQESKHYAEKIIETLPEPLVVLHPDLSVRTANQAFYDHFKVDPQTTIGRRIYDLGNGQWNIPGLRRLLEEVLPDNHVFNNYQVEHHFDDLGLRVMLLNARRLNHQQLILVGIRDITDHHRAERAVRESEEKYRVLVESTREYAMLMLDCDGRITMWSSGAERLFGYSEDEALGQSGELIFTPEDRAAGVPRQELETALRSGKADDDRWQMRKDGSRFWASGVTEALRRDGNVHGFAKVLRDNTARMEAERQLRILNEQLEHRVAERTDALERQNRQLRQLARQLSEAEQRERQKLSSVLHDGLQQILVAAALQLPTCRDGKAQATIERIQALLDRAIDVSRTLSYELSPPGLHSADFGESLRWLCEWFEQNHQVSVRLQLDDGSTPLPDELKTFLFHAIRELLLNGVKYSGRKTLQLHYDVLPEGRVRATISDTGTGFLPAELESDVKSRRGFGLLSIRERTIAMGGRFQIESAPGSGARFLLELPIDPDNPGSE